MQSTHDDLIVMVEDNDDDAFVAERAFRKVGLANPIKRFLNAEDTIAWLAELEPQVANGTGIAPGLVLLDLNLPGEGGEAVLRYLRASEILQKTPTIILTTSLDPKDIDRCYRMGANSYVQKPVSFEGLIDAVRRMTDFWFKVVVLPK